MLGLEAVQKVHTLISMGPMLRAKCCGSLQELRPSYQEAKLPHMGRI